MTTCALNDKILFNKLRLGNRFSMPLNNYLSGDLNWWCNDIRGIRYVTCVLDNERIF